MKLYRTLQPRGFEGGMEATRELLQEAFGYRRETSQDEKAGPVEALRFPSCGSCKRMQSGR
ncbi:hypothetical protein ACFCP7_16865 [Paenibacillus elgii]